MSKTLYTINTVNNFMGMIFEPFGKKFMAENPDFKVLNIMDDGLLADTRTYGGMTPLIASRMYNYARAAQDSGADGILVTCTSVNKATKLIRPFLSVPILNIEEPVAEQAAENGTRIGVLGTIPTSPKAISDVIREKAAEKGKAITIVERVADGAFDVLCAGDRERHDDMVRAELKRLAGEVDVIAFAQISMSLLPFDGPGVPVYKIGDSGFARIREMIMDGGVNANGR